MFRSVYNFLDKKIMSPYILCKEQLRHISIQKCKLHIIMQTIHILLCQAMSKSKHLSRGYSKILMKEYDTGVVI